MSKLFAAHLHCSLCLSVLQNNFGNLTKLFSDPAKFLDTSAESFFKQHTKILIVAHCLLKNY